MNMKKIILTFAVAVICGLSSMAATIQQMRFHCESDTTDINALLEKGAASGITTANDLVVFYAKELLGKPYVAHTLEGETEMLTINIHQLDCTTFVETLYALTRTTLSGRFSWRDYAFNLENLRYRDGLMTDYSSRLHYISDWINNNRMRGNMREITSDIPTAVTKDKSINFMSSHSSSYASLKNDSAMIARIRKVEDGYRNYRMTYIRKSTLGRDDVRAAMRSGDFVGLVTNIDGLDISHMGIIYKDERGEVFLLDASMSGGKVQLEEKPLSAYLKSSKSNIGVRLFRIM